MPQPLPQSFPYNIIIITFSEAAIVGYVHIPPTNYTIKKTQLHSETLKPDDNE